MFMIKRAELSRVLKLFADLGIDCIKVHNDLANNTVTFSGYLGSVEVHVPVWVWDASYMRPFVIDDVRGALTKLLETASKLDLYYVRVSQVFDNPDDPYATLVVRYFDDCTSNNGAVTTYEHSFCVRIDLWHSVHYWGVYKTPFCYVDNDFIKALIEAQNNRGNEFSSVRLALPIPKLTALKVTHNKSSIVTKAKVKLPYNVMQFTVPDAAFDCLRKFEFVDQIGFYFYDGRLALAGKVSGSTGYGIRCAIVWEVC